MELGGASGFEQDPSEDLLRMSLNGVGWESNPWRDAHGWMPLTTELRERPRPVVVRCQLVACAE